MKVTVNLTYFKQSGKYYTDGEFEMEVKDCRLVSSSDIGKGVPFLPDVLEEIRRMNEVGPMPGLSVRWDGPIWVNTEPECCPHLLLPPEMQEAGK